MSNRLNFTEDDAWAVLFHAAFADAFPMSPVGLSYGHAHPLGGIGLGPITAANFLRDSGVVYVDAGIYRLTDHPIALSIKAIAEQAAAQLAVDTAIAAREAFELLAQGGSASSKTSDASAAPFQRSPLQQAPEH